MKLMYAVGVIGLVGSASWQFIREYAKLGRSAERKREPWEMV